MNILKEQVKINDVYGTRCVIRTNTYGSNMKFFNDLLAIAKSDFPNVNDELVDVVTYDTPFCKYTMGLEFTVPAGETIPDEYKVREKLMAKL